MQKEAYYFSHDANARNDVKCLKVRREMGWEGYGIFWALIEILREQPGHELSLNSIDDLAYDLHTEPEKIISIIHNYGLFEIDGEMFSSARLLRSMEQYNSRRKKLSEAGRKGGLSQAKASLEPPPSIKGKEIKGKEIKGKEIKGKESKGKESKGKESKGFIKPTIAELICEFSIKLNSSDAMKEAEKFLAHYEARHWKMGQSKMESWRHAVIGWTSKIDEFSKNSSSAKIKDSSSPGTVNNYKL